MPKSCLTCKHWQEYYPSPDSPPEERSGSCEWTTTLPFSWRYARREVTGTMAYEGTECLCWTTTDMDEGFAAKVARFARGEATQEDVESTIQAFKDSILRGAQKE